MNVTVLHIQQKDNMAFNEDMDNKQIRLANMMILVERAGGIVPLANRIGSNQSYLSQLKSNKTKKDIGDSMARRMEMAFGLKRGWMDEVHLKESEMTQQQKDVDRISKTLQGCTQEGRDFIMSALNIVEHSYMKTILSAEQ